MHTDTNLPTANNDLCVNANLLVTKNGKTPRSGDASDGFQRVDIGMSSEEPNKEAHIVDITSNSLMTGPYSS